MSTLKATYAIGPIKSDPVTDQITPYGMFGHSMPRASTRASEKLWLILPEQGDRA